MGNTVIRGIVLITSLLFLSACADISREQASTIAGSVVGGAIGHQFGKGDGKTVMTIIGAAVGGYIGGNLGKQMTYNDHRKINSTLENTPNYQKVSWEDPNSQSQYTFTPVNQYEGKVNGQYTQCRDYVMDAWINGRMQQVHGRACKNPQGQWVNTQ